MIEDAGTLAGLVDGVIGKKVLGQVSLSVEYAGS